MRPADLAKEGAFRYIDVPCARSEAICLGAMRRVPEPLSRMLIQQVNHHWWAANVGRVIRQLNDRAPYDCVLFLGTWAFERVPSVPTVSWVQGPTGTDARAIVRHREVFRRLCGTKEYLKMRIAAACRMRIIKPPYQNSNVAICGSQWSAEVIAQEAPALRVNSLPYPVDLSLFRPSDEEGTRLTLLWLGRVVPRKRLDLFVDAAEMLISNGLDINVEIVGRVAEDKGVTYGRGYMDLVSGFKFPSRLRYRERVSHLEAADLLRTCGVLVQPSEEENFGSSVAEAIACGRPVVVGPTNGTGEWCGDAAFRFAKYEVESVAGSIRQALAAGSRDGFSSMARRQAEHVFDVKKITLDLQDVLHNLMGE